MNTRNTAGVNNTSQGSAAMTTKTENPVAGVMATTIPTVLVTGASRGIGLATALYFLREGYRVVMADRSPIDVETAGLMPFCGRILPITVDVTDMVAVHAMHDAIKTRWGRLQVLVNNAGISFKQPNGSASTLINMTDEEWDSVLAVNLTAVARLCRLFLPEMKEAGYGRIVNVSSLAGRTRSRVAGPAYVATKAAIIGLTRSIASDFGRDGITANCVAPGRIISAMSGPADTPLNQDYLRQIPSARFGTVDEVAAAIGYLVSDAAGFVNGAVIDVNGGAFMA